MLDRLLALIALAGLAAFLWPLVTFVPRVDLVTVCAAGFALALVDFLLGLRRQR